MKTIRKRLGIGFSVFATCTSLALVAQAAVIENWYLSNGLCYSPTLNLHNNCNLADVLGATYKQQICSGSCGSHNGLTILEIWQMVVP
ncbi:MAG TPA: hypothetical protein VL242_01375 [Sorangium sp.]|nr:hypothetical protein [Sorangium sp.]